MKKRCSSICILAWHRSFQIEFIVEKLISFTAAAVLSLTQQLGHNSIAHRAIALQLHLSHSNCVAALSLTEQLRRNSISHRVTALQLYLSRNNFTTTSFLWYRKCKPGCISSTFSLTSSFLKPADVVSLNCQIFLLDTNGCL